MMKAHDENVRAQLSYQPQDERQASSLAAALARAGADVVPTADADADADAGADAAGTDAVVLLWSYAAQAAGVTAPAGGERVVPVRLDDCSLPPLLSHLPQVRLAVGVTDAAAAAIARLALTDPPVGDKGVEPELPVVISDFGPLGQYETCPRCGVGSDRLRPYVTVDHHDDRALRLVICGSCGWQDHGDL
ncbi:TIR domain-containing protein [Streptomyces aquilus]|uniref:TIR domain-containing protein n=1 Tax=Streptomyces aquilus TaxID=2548456 RepID=A0A3S9HSX0_9ACTN|nr:TIR domain-containing protein [Streptomyces aquilus]